MINVLNHESAIASEPPRICTGVAAKWWLLSAAVLFLLFWNLGNRGLNEPDEGRYVNIAHEMLEAEHGWWVPRMSDFAHYDKPPLIYWTTAAMFNLFGESEWSARLPSVLGAALMLAGLGWTSRRLYGERVAWWAVILGATTVQIFVLARTLTPDMLLAGFVTLGIAFWAEERHREARGAGWWGCVVCWTLAWWTKATAALVPLAGLTLGLIITDDKAGLRALRPARLFAVVLVLGAPWYVSLMVQHPELRDFFLGRELVGRIAGHPDGRRGPVYYHVLISVVAWAPWWPWMLICLLPRLRQWRERKNSWRRVPWEAWTVLTGLILFSLISSKLVTYTLPCAPWVALLCTRVLLKQYGDGKRPVPMVASAIAVALFLAGGTFVPPRFESRLGVNSSAREIARFLRQRNANTVYLDRYRPGMEFYFGERVYYVTHHIPREVPWDAGVCAELGESHFLDDSQLAEHLKIHADANRWLVRLRGKYSSTLTAALDGLAMQESLQIGDSILDRLPANYPASAIK